MQFIYVDESGDPGNMRRCVPRHLQPSRHFMLVGVIVPTAEFMRELRTIADEIGACLIIDEIQAGFGRTGKWLCQEHYGVKADIITVAKGIASGYPLGAIVRGKVVSVTEYGAFVELEDGIEGLVHISEMTWNKRIKDPKKLVNSGDVIEAVRKCHEAQRIAPTLGQVYNDLGAILWSLGRHDEALRNFHRALRLSPESTEALQNYHDACAALGHNPEETP